MPPASSQVPPETADGSMLSGKSSVNVVAPGAVPLFVTVMVYSTVVPGATGPSASEVLWTTRSGAAVTQTVTASDGPPSSRLTELSIGYSPSSQTPPPDSPVKVSGIRTLYVIVWA